MSCCRSDLWIRRCNQAKYLQGKKQKKKPTISFREKIEKTLINEEVVPRSVFLGNFLIRSRCLARETTAGQIVVISGITCRDSRTVVLSFLFLPFICFFYLCFFFSVYPFSPGQGILDGSF